MRPVRLIAPFVTALAVSQPASAVPPPPAMVPEHLAQPADGYDSAALFQQWRYWVEGRKGPVTEALLAEPEVLDGLQPFGGSILTVRLSEDLGHFLTGDVRVYCRPAPSYRYAPGSCRYRLRRATVTPDAAALGGSNPVARWTVEAFDPVRLAAHLRRSGLAPDTDWWRADRGRMFSALPSPDPVLTRNATVTTVDSRDCPALGTALQALDQRRLGWRLDMQAVGEDTPVVPPPPHAVRAEYTLRIAPEGGSAELRGDGPAFEALIRPVLEAADACARAGGTPSRR